MIITCEACSRRYLINPESLGADGRTVKCTSCGFSWHQDPPEDMPKMLSNFPEDSIQKEEIEKFQEFEDTSDLISSEESMFGDVHDRSRSNNKIKERSSIKYKWFIFGFIIVGILSALYLGRYQIVDRWPYAKKLYEPIGIETNPLVHHLELQNVSWMPSVNENQNPIFILKGVIVNRSEKVQMIPLLSIVFLTSSKNGEMCKDAGCVVDRWVAHTSNDRILPGETYPFQIILSKTIPTDAVNLRVEFVRP